MTKTQIKGKNLELVVGNWHNALKKIKDRRGKVARMSEFIKIINNKEFEDEDNINIYGAYSTAGLDYAQNCPVLLLRKNSKLLQLENAEKAVQLGRDNKEYSITQEVYNAHLRIAEKSAKKAPEERNILILPKREDFNITLPDYFDILRFLAESPEEAEKYFERFLKKGIDYIGFNLKKEDYVDKRESPFTDQLWLDWRKGVVNWVDKLPKGSNFGDYFGGWKGHNQIGVFAIFQKSGESKQEIFSIYDPLSEEMKRCYQMHKLEEGMRARMKIRESDYGLITKYLLIENAARWEEYTAQYF